MLTIKYIFKAKEVIKDFVRKTPLIEFEKDLFLKLECAHDKVNAFKIRGAYNEIVSHIADGHKTIVNCSMGSFGIASGIVCKKLGIKSIGFCPKNTTLEKRQKLKRYLDELFVLGNDFSESEKLAKDYVIKNNYLFIHPYNDPEIIAGQGTIGLEVYEDLKDVKNVYVPIGGGGLISGISIALKHLNPEIRIIGVKPKDDKSIAEPLCVKISNSITLDYINNLVDKIIFVDEIDIKKSMKKIFDKTGIMVEGAGAITLAAHYLDTNKKGKSVCIVSGSNISEDRFRKIVLNI